MNISQTNERPTDTTKHRERGLFFADWLGIEQAVAQCKAGKGLIKVNGKPLQLVEPAVLRVKVRLSERTGLAKSPTPWMNVEGRVRSRATTLYMEEQGDVAGSS